VHRFPEAGGGLFSTTHDIFRYGLMLSNDGELEGKRYLSHAAMDELRREQTGATKVNYSLGYHLRNGMFGHDGAYGTDLSVNPATGMVAIFMIQCTSDVRWAARDQFLKTATQVFDELTANDGAQASPAYPLRKSANGHYFVDAKGAPFLLAGDAPQALMVRLSEADADFYFSNRVTHGFNAVWINLLCRQGTGGRKDGATYDGIAPFVSPDDLSIPN